MCFTHSIFDAPPSLDLPAVRRDTSDLRTTLESEVLADQTPLRYRYTDLFYPLVPRFARTKKGAGRGRTIYVNPTANQLAKRRLIDEARNLAFQALGEHVATKLPRGTLNPL